jgi:replicative DNA helicase
VELMGDVTEEYFLSQHNKIVFLALSLLQNDPKVEKIDLPLLIQASKSLGIESTGVLDQYFIIISSTSPDESNYDFYVDKLKNSYKKYKLYTAASRMQNEVFSFRQDLSTNPNGEELTEKFLAELSLIEAGQDRDETVSMSEVIDDFVEEINSRGNDLIGLETGFKSLDQAINGLRAGTLTIFAGPPKGGKSTLMLNIARHVIEHHKIPVLYLSTEMSYKEDLSRLLAQISEVDERAIISGKFKEDKRDQERVEAAIFKIKNEFNLYYEYLPQFNSKIITNRIRRAKLKYGIGLAVFDYIKMETVAENSKDIREDQILGDITNALKISAGTLDIPVVTGCQINTRTNNVADSDRLIRYCNTLIRFDPKSDKEFDIDSDTFEEDVKKYGTHWLTVKESRGGGSAKRIPVTFYKSILKTIEADTKQEEDEDNEDGRKAKINYKLNTLSKNGRSSSSNDIWINKVKNDKLSNNNQRDIEDLTTYVSQVTPEEDEDPLF